MFALHSVDSTESTSKKSCFQHDKQTNKQSTHPYRIPMSLFVLCAVAAVAERLVAVVVSRELAKERLLPGVRPAKYILEDDKTLLL